MRRVLVALTVAAVAAAGYAGYAVAASSSDPSASCDPPSYDGTNLTLHCVVPQQTVTSTETDTVTATTTETATETQTVPGPTATVTPTPTTTTPPPPPPPGTFAPGESLNATNTGYAADGVTASQLTPQGAITYGTAFNGQTITLKAYTGTVYISGSHITIKDCSLTNGGLNAVGFEMHGSYNTVQNCTITSPAGQSMYEPVWVFGDHNTVDGVNISRGENALTTYGTNVTIRNSWLHDTSLASQPSDHPDSIEVYGGGNVLILNNRIVEACGGPSSTPPCPYSGQPGMFDSPINVAPYNSYKVQGLTIQGNFLDNGQGATLIDNQNTSCAGATGNCLINVKVVGNAFGGHQCPASNPQCIGIFTPLENYENRVFVQTDAGLAANPNAIEWPTTGADVNRREESNDIATSSTPHDGDVVTPS